MKSDRRAPLPKETWSFLLVWWIQHLAYKLYLLVVHMLLYPRVWYIYKWRGVPFVRMPDEMQIAWWQFHGWPADYPTELEPEFIRRVRGNLAFHDARRPDKLNG
ncbi:hypothetical protein CIW50_27770 [Tardiphaga sp. P9-11]|nr:hypothetical protein CIW50_27770 [Tardiphaga sp. P9-11]